MRFVGWRAFLCLVQVWHLLKPCDRRFIEKTGTTVLFVVDASGSSALYRLAEAKGAVELLLAETYARRDRVSLIAFRGQGTDVLLPPTRALARAPGRAAGRRGSLSRCLAEGALGAGASEGAFGAGAAGQPGGRIQPRGV